jgi:uncharacterized protein YkwD
MGPSQFAIGNVAMYRIIVCAALALLLAGCSMASSSLSAGYAEQEQTGSLLSSRSQRSESPSVTTRPAATGPRVANADDKIPRGAFEKAPAGALSDRDYSATHLDPEKARDLINAYRREKGLKPLKLNPLLSEAAKAHSRDLAKWDRISHFGSDGSNPWDRVKRTGYNAKLAAENVGTGQVTIEEVVKGWQKSPGHDKNLLLADAEHMGIGLVQDPRTEFKTFWTLVIAAGM